MGPPAPPPPPSNGLGAASSAQSPQSRAIDLGVQDVLLGHVRIRPWYMSFYPEELVGRRVEMLFVCQWCFRYSKDLLPSVGHAAVCPFKEDGAPGSMIYKQGDFSIFEVDGEKHKLYAQNLSLFAKLFLDTKAVFYDVTTFLYYLLVLHDAHADPAVPPQVVGFFSKEKLSWDSNNLACILVFPPWQRKGLGQILMETSYVLSKREGRFGGPEKPLSDPGRCSYLHYWSSAIARFLVQHPAKKTITVQDVCDETFIVAKDVIATLKEMGVLELKKRAQVDAVINKARVRQWVDAHKVNLTPPVDHDAFILDDGEASREEDEDMEDVED